MNNALHSVATQSPRTSRRGRWAGVLVAGLLGLGGVLGLADAAQAAPVAGDQVAVVSAHGAARGKTVNYNEGYAGSCVFYALDRFHAVTGVYPKAFGDARLLATGAAKSGWTVSATPRVNSIAIFQPGANGAASTGHAAWVEKFSGNRIYIGEMNAPVAGVVTHRWIDAPAASVRYIYAS